MAGKPLVSDRVRTSVAAAAVMLGLIACTSDRIDATPAATRTASTAAADRAEAPQRPAGTTPPASTPTSGTTVTDATTAASASPRSTAHISATTTTSTTVTTTTTTTTGTGTATTTTVLRDPTDDLACPPTGSSIWDVRPPSQIAPPQLPGDWTVDVIGTTVRGRDIEALVRLVDSPRRRVLVIGGLHGNEPVSPPTVRGLVEAANADGVEVWLVPEANPDGVAAGTRCNANGVDLNRNFPWGWRSDDGGAAPLSEPETQAITTLVDRLQPDLVVWVHQPYGYVSSIGPTSSVLEGAWAAAAGVPVRPDVTQHGGGESWTALVAARPSMLIEIDGWSATTETIAAHRAGYEAAVAALL